MCYEFVYKTLWITHQWFLTITEQYLHSVKFFSLSFSSSSFPLPSAPVSRLRIGRRLGASKPGQQFQIDRWDIPYHMMLCLGINVQKTRQERGMLQIIAFVFPCSCNIWLCFSGCRWTSAYWWDLVNEFLFWSNFIFFPFSFHTQSLFFSIKLSLVLSAFYFLSVLWRREWEKGWMGVAWGHHTTNLKNSIFYSTAF